VITINHANGLIEIETYQQLLELPGFQPNLDPKIYDPAKLKLIGICTFREMSPCGLKSCHQLHFRGYVAENEDGTRTNLGHRCGRKWLGAENWDLMKNVLHADIRAKKHRETVDTFKARIPELRQSLRAMREHPSGASWAWLTLSQLELPHRVWPVLERMVKSTDGRLMIEREATAEEAALHDTRTRAREDSDRPRYIEVQAGYIEGILAKDPRKNLRDLLTYGILANLDRISKIDVDTAKPGVVAAAAKWIAECDARVQEVKEVLEAARRFLTKSNLMQLRHVLNTSEADHLRRCVAKLPQTYQSQDTEAA